MATSRKPSTKSKSDEDAKEQTLEDFQAEVNAAVASKNVPVEKPAAQKAPDPPQAITVPIEIGADGSISPRMAEALQQVAEKVPDQMPPSEEQRLAKIKFSGQKPKDTNPPFLGRRDLGRVRRRERKKEDPVWDLKKQIMDMRCPSCDSTTFRFCMEPRHFGLPSGICQHCSYRGDVVELHLMSEKDALERLQKMGVEVEVDDVR